MGDGKRAPAPCGHEGETIIGTYVRCAKCDSKDFIEEEITFELLTCPYCKSIDIDYEFCLDPVFYFFNPGAPLVDTRCNDCGKVWTR